MPERATPVTTPARQAAAAAIRAGDRRALRRLLAQELDGDNGARFAPALYAARRRAAELQRRHRAAADQLPAPWHRLALIDAEDAAALEHRIGATLLAHHLRACEPAARLPLIDLLDEAAAPLLHRAATLDAAAGPPVTPQVLADALANLAARRSGARLVRGLGRTSLATLLQALPIAPTASADLDGPIRLWLAFCTLSGASPADLGALSRCLGEQSEAPDA